MTTEMNIADEKIITALKKDYDNSGEKGSFDRVIAPEVKESKAGIANKRQGKQI